MIATSSHLQIVCLSLNIFQRIVVKAKEYELFK
jgi:hypothetical protein